MTAAVSEWKAAQRAERDYWYPSNPSQHAARRQEEHERALWIADLLDIRPETVAGANVLDIGGGPQPIVAWPDLPLARRVVVDPMAVDAVDAAASANVERVVMNAEDYAGPVVDEVWGYNVLQHVVDPVAVLRVAMQQARLVVRWFEWVDQPTSVVHPHVITPSTFDVLGSSWRRTEWVEGVRDEGRGWSQAYVAGVWRVAL